MAFPDEFLYQLKLANPVDSVISSYVNLKRSGHDAVGLCPFHSEKTPSFHVYNDTQSFYCFGCGAGGDVITFIKRIENLEYIEAVKLLAQRGGLDIPEDSRDNNAAMLKKRIYEINRETANFYFRQLVSGPDKRGLQYFAGRKLRPETIKKYGLGYAPSGWHTLSTHLHSLGFTNREMLAADVVRLGKDEKSVYDTFRERVIFPIIDLRGHVIAFGGRLLGDGSPKYLNTSETPVFQKKRNLFSLNFAKNSPLKRMILAEGYMDVIAINQAGFENVVATLGTSLTGEQARILKTYADDVIIAYDSDSAGQKATQRAINLLSEAGLNTRIIKMEGAKDPDEFLKKFGPHRFKLLLDNSDGAINFELAKCKEGLDTETDTGKVELLKRSVKVLSMIYNRLERDVYISKVARENDISIDILRAQIDSEIKKRRNSEKKSEWTAIKSKPYYSDPLVPEVSKALKEVKAEEGILAYLFRYPDKIETVMSSMTDDCFITEFYRRVYNVLCMKIQNINAFSFSIFSDEFNNEEMGRITGIEAKNKEIVITEQNLHDYIKILLDYKNNPIKNKDSYSDDDLLNIVSSKKRK